MDGKASEAKPVADGKISEASDRWIRRAAEAVQLRGYYEFWKTGSYAEDGSEVKDEFEVEMPFTVGEMVEM